MWWILRFEDGWKNVRKRLRNKPSPGDPDFADRTVAQAKEVSFSDLGETEEEFLRRKCLAEIAIHNRDSAAFSHAMQGVTQWVEQWSGVQRRSAMMQTGTLYHRLGDQDSARRAYDEVLGSFLQPTEGLDRGRILLSTGDFFDRVVQVMSVEESDLWIVRLVSAMARTGSTRLI